MLFLLLVGWPKREERNEKQFGDLTGIIFFECRRISRVKISPHRAKIGLINSYTIDLKVLNVREKVRVPFSRLF